MKGSACLCPLSCIKTQAQKYEYDLHLDPQLVCNKKLKDRKGRTLSLDDIKVYCKIVIAVQKTIEIQKDIDIIYPGGGKETVCLTF